MSAEQEAADCFQVIGRRRWDPMSVARVTDFRLRRGPSAELSQRWSPYCFDAQSGRVALVGCPTGIDFTAAPFYYQAQYQHAQQLMLADRASFAALAEAHTPRFATPVMIYSTGRAGTTLVSKMFARLPSCVSLSEPDFHTSLLEAGVANPAALDTAVPLVRAANQLYFQPPDDRATHLVLKFRGMCVELADVVRQAHPNVVDFFLYRDVEAYVVSSMRAFSYRGSALWAIRRLHFLGITRPILTQVLSAQFTILCRFFPLVANYTPRELSRLGPVGLLALSWLSMMDRARLVGLASLRYETLLRDPRAVVERLLARCGLDDDAELALAAMNQDSQRGSVVGRERTTHYELSARDRAIVRKVLARHSVIDRADYDLPNAIA